VGEYFSLGPSFQRPSLLLTGWGCGIWIFYFEQIRVFKADACLNILAWNNRIGLWSYFVGFKDLSND